MNTFELYYKQIHIGTLTELNWDMRSSGTIVYHFNYLNPKLNEKRLSEYILFSHKESEALENGDEKKLEEIAELSNDYIDFIESEDWFIIDNNAKRIKILSPLFFLKDEIVWQVIS
jgi:hypothetical protein